MGWGSGVVGVEDPGAGGLAVVGLEGVGQAGLRVVGPGARLGRGLDFRGFGWGFRCGCGEGEQAGGVGAFERC